MFHRHLTHYEDEGLSPLDPEGHGQRPTGRDVARHHYADKVWIVKAIVFPVVMYGYESWTIKKAESWRTDASELGCWRRLLSIPWTPRKSNESILKQINTEYSLDAEAEAPVFWPSDVKNWLSGKDLDAGKDWRQEKGEKEDKIVGWHKRLNGCELE